MLEFDDKEYEFVFKSSDKSEFIIGEADPSEADIALPPGEEGICAKHTSIIYDKIRGWCVKDNNTPSGTWVGLNCHKNMKFNKENKPE
mmetsp:Transcript_18364/g.8565  ORF Transcript_18364/g.8565 Transcript_18364/m.8565 type:complete len:88 (+) Transcript_18364:1835-2098(+)